MTTDDQPPLFKLDQRWRNRRDFYVPPEARFDPREFGADVIVDNAAKTFVAQNHYLHSSPASRLCVGLFHKPGVAPAYLAGVAIFSVPMTQAAIPAHTGLAPEHGCELGRLVLLDGPCGFNAESWFVARAFRHLRQEKPEIETVLSYSDPVPRIAADGTATFLGHAGTVYQSLSAVYRGRSSPRTLWLTPSADVISDRTMSKIRAREKGWRYAVEQLVAIGAPRPDEGADLSTWLTTIKDARLLRPIRHSGNHTYVFPLSSRARQSVARKQPTRIPYPRKSALAA